MRKTVLCCALVAYLIAFNSNRPNYEWEQQSVSDTTIKAVVMNRNNGFTLIESNKDNDCLFPKISKDLDNQIKKQLIEIEQQEIQEEINQKKIQYDKDLYLLAQVVHAEAGADNLSDEFQLMVANIVMNRVDSPYFSDTIYDVVHAPNQYQFIKHEITVIPNKRALANAQRVLDGYRTLPKNVLYQSEYRMLGDGCYTKIKTKYSTTYFNYKK